MRNTAAVIRRRLLGLMFFAVVIGFVAVTVMQYQKVFTPVVKVNLITDSAGNALPKNGDVKIRGKLVGTVRGREILPNGNVRLLLAINPGDADLIPSNSTARLLPKTLFGERYVALQTPEHPDGSLQAGDTLVQDRSGNAVQISAMLDSLLPILKAVPPQDLSSTLGAINQMLANRGAKIGYYIDQLDTIFKQINGRMPDLQADIKSTADFAHTYSKAAPDLIDALDNLRTTNKTVVEKQDQIRALMSSVIDTGAHTTALLQANHDTIITVASDLRDPLQILAQASPAFGCTFKDFADVEQKAKSIVGYGTDHPAIRVSLLFVNPRGRYLPNQDEPRLFDTRTAKCYRTAQPNEHYPIPDGTLNDGSYQPPTTNPAPSATVLNNPPSSVSNQYPPAPLAQYFDNTNPLTGGQQSLIPQVGYAGSEVEQQTLKQLYGGVTGTSAQDVPGWTTLMGAPAVRGNEVTIK